MYDIEDLKTRIQKAENRRESIRSRAERMLVEIRDLRDAQANLTEPERVKLQAMQGDLADLDEDIRSWTEDAERCEIPEKYRQLGLRGAGGVHGRVNSGAVIAPLDFDPEAMRELHTRLLQQQAGRIEARAFGSASALLPAQLYPQPTFPLHETRLLSKLPAFAVDVPSLEVIQVNSVTGSPAIVAEGEPQARTRHEHHEDHGDLPEVGRAHRRLLGIDA